MAPKDPNIFGGQRLRITEEVLNALQNQLATSSSTRTTKSLKFQNSTGGFCPTAGEGGFYWILISRRQISPEKYFHETSKKYDEKFRKIIISGVPKTLILRQRHKENFENW